MAKWIDQNRSTSLFYTSDTEKVHFEGCKKDKSWTKNDTLLKWYIYIIMCRNEPMFSNIQIWANSADPANSAVPVYTVCHSICIF